MGVVRRQQLKKVITLQRAMTKKCQFFGGTNRCQLPPRVTPTLVTPLACAVSLKSLFSFVHTIISSLYIVVSDSNASSVGDWSSIVKSVFSQPCKIQYKLKTINNIKYTRKKQIAHLSWSPSTKIATRVSKRASLGCGGERGGRPPWVTQSRGVTPE